MNINLILNEEYTTQCMHVCDHVHSKTNHESVNLHPSDSICTYRTNINSQVPQMQSCLTDAMICKFGDAFVQQRSSTTATQHRAISCQDTEQHSEDEQKKWLLLRMPGGHKLLWLLLYVFYCWDKTDWLWLCGLKLLKIKHSNSLLLYVCEKTH